MRKLIYSLAALVGVLAIALLAVLLLLTTETGSLWVVNHVSEYVPGKLTIGRIQGSVFSGLNLYEVDQYFDQRHTQIRHIELDWQPMALLGGTVLLHSLNISGITYTVAEKKEVTTSNTFPPLQNISFPLSVVVEKARLDRLDFYQGSTQYSLDYVHFTGRADQNGLRLKRLEAEGEGVYVSLRGHSSFCHPYPFQANLNWNVWLPNGVQARGKCDLSGDIDLMELTLKLSTPFTLQTQCEVKLNRKQINFKNDQQKRHSLLYDLTLMGDSTGQDLPPTPIETHAQNNFSSIKVENLAVHTLGGKVKVNGHIVMEPEPAGELTVNATDIDPSVQWSDWPGKLAFDAKVQGKIDAGTPTVLLYELKLVGQLLEQPLKATGDLTLRGISQISGDLKIRSGNNLINISGTVAPHLIIKFDVDTPNPVSLWPGLRGHLQGKGMLKGTRSNPAGTLILKGKNIKYGDYKLQNLHAELAFDLNNTRLSNAKVEMFNLRVGHEVLQHLTLTSVGDLKNHKVSIDIKTPSGRIAVEFEGNCDSDIWKFQVDTASFDLIRYGKWQLQNPVHLLLNHSELKPFSACWGQEKSGVCVRGAWNDESGWKTQGDVNKTPIKDMIDLLKELFKEENLGWDKSSKN